MYFSMTKTIYSLDTTSFKLGQLLMVRKWFSYDGLVNLTNKFDLNNIKVLYDFDKSWILYEKNKILTCMLFFFPVQLIL